MILTCLRIIHIFSMKNTKTHEGTGVNMFVAGVSRFTSQRVPFPLVNNTRLESDNNPNIEPPNI